MHLRRRGSRRDLPGSIAGAGVAALDEHRGRIEPQARLLPQRAVAGVAAGREDRLDLRDVIDAIAGRRKLAEPASRQR